MIRVGVDSHLAPMLVKSAIVKVCSGGISRTRLISAIRFLCIENQDQKGGIQKKKKSIYSGIWKTLGRIETAFKT